MDKVKKYISDQDPIITDTINKAGLNSTVKILIWEYSKIQNQELTDRVNRLESLIDSVTSSLDSEGMNSFSTTIKDILKTTTK